MNPSIRGHQANFQVYDNGKRRAFDCVTSISINQDSNFSKTFYVGQAIGEGDQTAEGWSGQLELEVKSDEVDKFIDALITNNMNGIGYADYALVTTENYADGTSASYAYSGMNWKMSRSQSGLNEKIKKRLDFQAMTRVRL